MRLNNRLLELTRPLQGYAMVSGSIGGLLLGLVAGAGSHGAESGLLHEASPYIKAAGTLWLNALSAIVIPLMAANVIAAVLRGKDARETSILSGKVFSLFVVWLVIGAVFTLTLMPLVLSTLTVDTSTVRAMTASLPAQAIAAVQTRPPLTTPTDVVTLLVPRNLLKAALNEELLPILIFAIAFAFAILKTNTESREMLSRFFRAVADALFQMVRWLVAFLPFGAFAMAFMFTESAGVGVAGVLAQFTLLSCGAMLAFTLFLYPLTSLTSGVSIRTFAAGVLPAQLAAVSTRSSLASLPALLEGGTTKLRLDPMVANLALPLSVAMFKVNRTISSLVKMLFIAHLFSVPLGIVQIVTFTVTVMILSFTNLGIPGGGGSFKSMAAYMAIGLPIEGYVLLEATDAIADIFKTVLNVTGDMSVTTVLDRRMKKARGVVDEAASPREELVAVSA